MQQPTTLSVSRQRGEAIVYDVPPSDTPTRVIVRVRDIRGDRTRLASTAPKDVKIMRDEIAPPDPTPPPKELTAADWFDYENKMAWMLNIG